MSEPTKAQKFVRDMNWMIASGREVEAMDRIELVESLCELDHYHISSLESAIFGESVFRLQHPMTWRLRRVWQKIDARYSAWKYLRRGCKFNKQKKCMVPTRCKIGPTGSCEGFEAIPLSPKTGD